jgi:hypothetical protein
MKKTIDMKVYSTPQIERINLDNEISLILESDAPYGEPSWSQNLENNKDNPFKETNC